MIPRNTAEFHCFDWGMLLSTEIRNERNRVIDLSAATLVEIIFMRPDGSTILAEASLGTPNEVLDSGIFPGEDGKVYYIIPEGTLDLEGNWFFEFRISIEGVSSWSSSVIAFVVLPSLFSIGEMLTP